MTPEQLDLELEDDMMDVSDDEVEFVNETFAATEGLDVSDEEIEFAEDDDDSEDPEDPEEEDDFDEDDDLDEIIIEWEDEGDEEE